MGYRSEWHLAAAGTLEKITGLQNWLTQRKEATYRQGAANTWSSTVGETYETIINCFTALVDVEGDEGHLNKGILYSHDFMKCYDPWDRVIDEIAEYCTDNDIAFGYGRLGEDPGDVSIEDNGKGVYISWERRLVPPFG